MSQALNEQNSVTDFIDGNNNFEDDNQKEIIRLKIKNELLEKKLNCFLQNKDEIEHHKQMSTFLGTIQNQNKGNNDIKKKNLNKKNTIKSKSLLTNSSAIKNSQQISLYKFDDKLEIQKSSLVDKKSDSKIITSSKNKSQRVKLFLFRIPAHWRL